MHQGEREGERERERERFSPPSRGRSFLEETVMSCIVRGGYGILSLDWWVVVFFFFFLLLLLLLGESALAYMCNPVCCSLATDCHKLFHVATRPKRLDSLPDLISE